MVATLPSNVTAPATHSPDVSAAPCGALTRMPAPTSDVQRTAFYLRSRGEPLFAWLHTSIDLPILSHGVVICPPLGYEQLHAHRTLRDLADALARHQIPVLRFDWHGTGDSAGSDEDPGRCAHWMQNVQDTVAWMRNEAGCRQVSVIGLRLGALLAAAALSQKAAEVDQLVLWAPVLKGQSYVREMRASDRMSEAPRDPADQNTNDIEAGGFVLTAETALELATLKLSQSSPRCQRVLLVQRDDSTNDERLAAWAALRQIPIDEIAVSGYAAMMNEPHRSQVPVQAIQEITNWLREHIQANASEQEASAAACLNALLVSAEPCARIGRLREEPWQISPAPDLFGIMTRPEVETDGRPIIVLLNAGAAHRIGPGRLSVLLARDLATQGFRVLRVDVCGLGDSHSRPFEPDHDPYPATFGRDVDIVLTRLREAYGETPCVLAGLCSGAYNAFQAAAQLEHPTLVGSVLINPLTFYWEDGMTLDAAPARQLIRQQYYLKSALQWRKWLQMFSGRTTIGIGGALRLLAQRLLWSPRRRSLLTLTKPLRLPEILGNRAVHNRFCQGLLNSPAGSEGGSSDCRTPGHPQRQDLPADLVQVAKAKRWLGLFFATSDPGYGILMHQARRTVKRLERSGMLRIQFVERADHTFSRRSARQKLSQLLVDYLVGN